MRDSHGTLTYLYMYGDLNRECKIMKRKKEYNSEYKEQ